jgi:hypothetical protein
MTKRKGEFGAQRENVDCMQLSGRLQPGYAALRSAIGL